jgi:hypothetical protein
LKKKLTIFLSDELHILHKDSGEIVGHNGPIYKTPLSNFYFMATVQRNISNIVFRPGGRPKNSDGTSSFVVGGHNLPLWSE